MGLLDSITSWFDAYADEPQKEEPEDDEQVNEEADEKEGEDGEEDEEEEEEEDEEEPVDIKEQLEEECAQTAACKGHKHHYDDCVARVTNQIENDGGAKEDCVEEFFELTHCVAQCAAPKLFKQLK